MSMSIPLIIAIGGVAGIALGALMYLLDAKLHKIRNGDTQKQENNQKKK